MKKMTISRPSLLLALVLVFGCRGETLGTVVNDGGSDGDGDTDGDGDGDGDGDTDGDGDGDGDSDGDTDTLGVSCRFVDMLISVDPSGSMTEELRAMRTDIFPAFASRLGDIGEGLDDFRIATIDSCPDPANFHTRGRGGECDFHGGNAWIESSSSTMNEEFACVGDIYLGDINCSGDNDDEQPASAAATALESPFVDVENAGFLRDNALFVLVAITDEDEQPTGTAQSAEEVFDRLVAIKGDAKKMVMLGIGGSQSCSNGTYGSASRAEKLNDITNMFIAEDRGVWWNLCEGRLEDGLEEAFDIIEQACFEFPPVE